MFDIGFFELVLIAIVGLLVIGPERLPDALRTLGLWVGRIKRGLRETRAEIEQQLGADEIRRQLYNEEIMSNLKETRDEVNDVVKRGDFDTKNILNDQLRPKQSPGSKPSPPTPAAPDTKPAASDSVDKQYQEKQ